MVFYAAIAYFLKYIFFNQLKSLGEKMIKSFISWIFIFTNQIAFTDMTAHGFDPFINNIFVETGSYKGYGIHQALDAGFKVIHSIDIDPEYFAHCKRRFANMPNVHLWLGDSGKDLFQIIEEIEEPITFWLDGHNIFPKENMKNTPLMEELDQIKRHKIKNHTILIDDMHCCNTAIFDCHSLEDIVNKIKEINPAYLISFTGGWVEGSSHLNILVASIPKPEMK